VRADCTYALAPSPSYRRYVLDIFSLLLYSLPLSLSLSLLDLSLARRSLNIDQRGRHVANDEANGQLVEPRANAGKRWPLIRLSSTLASICLITCSRHGAVLISVRSNVPPQFHFRRSPARDGGLNSPPPENILLHVSPPPSPVFSNYFLATTVVIVVIVVVVVVVSASARIRCDGWDDVIRAIIRDGRNGRLRFDSITCVLANNIGFL